MRNKKIRPVKSNRVGIKLFVRVKLSAILLLGLGLTGSQAQESVNATGGNTSGSGGSVSYSVGQVAYQTHSGTNGSVAQGVQQPYEISVVTTVEQAVGIQLNITVYPNPTTDFLTLSIENYNFSELTYQLYDINGRLLKKNRLTGDKTQIDMTNQVAATYFLQVFAEGKRGIKTFKIIKK